MKEKEENLWRRKYFSAEEKQEEEKYNEDRKIVAGQLKGWTGIEGSTRGPRGPKNI